VTYRAKDLLRDLANPLHHIETPRDLTLRYWWLPNLGKVEEARLVGLAQSRDRRALAELFKHFHKFILGVAGKHMRGRSAGNWNKQTTDLFGDLVAAGCVGFCEALRNFDLSLGYRFSTPARLR
jgi:DNA-directed RNA polymerase specialized sigma subunit